MVRARLGPARGGHDRDPQGVVRRQSSLRDEPPFRLADPGDEPHRFPRPGIIRVGRRSGLAARRSLAPAADPVRARLVADGLDRLSSDLYLGLAGPDPGGGVSTRPADRIECPAVPAVRPGQLSGGIGDAALVGGVTLDQGPDQAIARECAASTAAGVAQPSLDRARHGRGPPPEPVWIPAPHEYNPGRARRAGDSIRFRPGDRFMDIAFSCDELHRSMDARTLGRLAQPARRGISPRWPSSSVVGATRRPASSPTPCIAPATRA